MNLNWALSLNPDERAWFGAILMGAHPGPPNAAMPPPRIELVEPRDEIDELVNWQLETGRGR